MYFISRYSKLTQLGLSLAPATRWALSTGIIFFISAIWYFSAYRPFNNQCKDLCTQLERIDQEESIFTTLTRKMNDLESSVNARTTLWNERSRELVQQGDHERLFGLFNLFSKQDIALQSYYPRAAVDRGWYIKQSAQIHFNCSFDQLINLLGSLKTSVVQYRIDQLRIERKDAQLSVVATVSYKIPKEIRDDKA